MYKCQDIMIYHIMMEYLPLKNTLLSVNVLVLRCIYSKGRHLDTMAITPALLTLMEISVNFKSPTVLDVNTNPPQDNSQKHRIHMMEHFPASC